MSAIQHQTKKTKPDQKPSSQPQTTAYSATTEELPDTSRVSLDTIQQMQQHLGNRRTGGIVSGNGSPNSGALKVARRAAPVVQRRPQLAEIAGHAVQSGQFIQLAREYADVKGNAHLRVGTNQEVYLDSAGKEHDGSDPAKDKAETIQLIDENRGIGPKLENHWFTKNDRLIVDVTKRARPTAGGAGKYEWVWGQAGGYEGYIRKSKIKVTGMPAPTNQNLQTTTQAPPGGTVAEEEEHDTAFSQISEFAGGNLTDPLGERIDLEYLKENKDGYYQDKEGASKSLEGHKNNLDMAAGSFDVFGGLIKLVVSIKKGNASTDSWDKAAAVFSGLEGASKMISGGSKMVDAGMKMGDNKGWDVGNKITGSVGEAFTAVRAFFDVIYKAVKLHSDWQKKGTESKVKSIVDIIKSLLEGTVSVLKVVRGFMDAAGAGISAGLTTAIPGLGIAMGGASLAMNGYNFLKAWISNQELKLLKHEQMNKVAQTGSTAVKKKQQKFHMFSKLKTEVQSVDEEALKQQKTTATGAQKDELDKLDLIHELGNIQDKREVRASLHIFTAMASIAGDIATLSGVGATAGVPLKALSAGVEGGMVGLRTIKQFGRDKGWAGFNAEKSSDKKHQKRVDHAKLIMKIVSSLPTPYANDHYQQYDMAQKLLNATGVDTTELAAETDPIGQLKLLVNAMKQRE